MDGFQFDAVANGIEASIQEIAILKRMIHESSSEVARNGLRQTLLIAERRHATLQAALEAALKPDPAISNRG